MGLATEEFFENKTILLRIVNGSIRQVLRNLGGTITNKEISDVGKRVAGDLMATLKQQTIDLSEDTIMKHRIEELEKELAEAKAKNVTLARTVYYWRMKKTNG